MQNHVEVLEAFGKSLKKLRCKCGLSQQKLAEIFDLQRTTITNYESGKSFPNLELFVEIVKFFGVPSDLMLGLVDDAPIEHYKPKRPPAGASNPLWTWVSDAPPEAQERIAQLENRANTILEMAGRLSDEIQEIRSGKL